MNKEWVFIYSVYLLFTLVRLFEASMDKEEWAYPFRDCSSQFPEGWAKPIGEVAHNLQCLAA
jgi:hypothetical protein